MTDTDNTSTCEATECQSERRRGVQVFKKVDNNKFNLRWTDTHLIINGEALPILPKPVERITVKVNHNPFHFYREQVDGGSLLHAATSDEHGNLTLDHYSFNQEGVFQGPAGSDSLPANSAENMEWWQTFGPKLVTETIPCVESDYFHTRTYAQYTSHNQFNDLGECTGTTQTKEYVSERVPSKRFMGATHKTMTYFPVPDPTLVTQYQTVCA